MHGKHNDLLIDGNLIYEEKNTSKPHCWGIAVDPAYKEPEYFRKVVIKNNLVMHMGNLSIGCTGCTDSKIINNTVYYSKEQYRGRNIQIDYRKIRKGDSKTGDVEIYGNRTIFSE